MISTGYKKGALASLVLAMIAATPALAQQPPQLSDDAVKKYMDYAWEMLPEKFTKPDGGVILIDKTARAKIEVPVETGRDAIMAGRRTAYAQACGFGEVQVAHYRSLMVREEEKKKWTEPQMMFISQIHITTGMLLNGTIRLVETDAGGKEIKVEEETAPKISKPSDAVCNDMLAQIETYIKAGPKIPYNPNAPDAAAAAPAAPAAKAAAKPAAAPATTGATPAKKP